MKLWNRLKTEITSTKLKSRDVFGCQSHGLLPYWILSENELELNAHSENARVDNAYHVHCVDLIQTDQHRHCRIWRLPKASLKHSFVKLKENQQIPRTSHICRHLKSQNQPLVVLMFSTLPKGTFYRVDSNKTSNLHEILLKLIDERKLRAVRRGLQLQRRPSWG